MFSSLYTNVTKKTVRETPEQKAEVVGPPSSRCNGPLKLPRGVHTCKGRNWEELFTLQVASGSARWPVSGLCQDSSPSGWVIAHLISDHQAQWTINLNHTAPLYVFWHFLQRKKSYHCFLWAGMCKEQGGEIPASALIVTFASGFSKDRMSRPSQF